MLPHGNVDHGETSNHITDHPISTTTLQIQKLSQTDTLPTKVTPESAAYDLNSTTNITIPPLTLSKIPTNLAIRPPPGTYCQIPSQSGMILNHDTKVTAGTIDHDYTGNVQVVLKNNSNPDYQVKQGDRRAQMIIYQITLDNTTAKVNKAEDKACHQIMLRDGVVRIYQHLSRSTYMARANGYTAGGSAPQPDKDRTGQALQGYYTYFAPSLGLHYYSASTNRSTDSPY
jgi:dUTP pyrophosphatase